jgi:hypothetical protein
LLIATQQLQTQQQQMMKATGDLEDKRKQLAKIIETENLTTLFAKLRSDFYRIHTLEARVEYRASAQEFSKDLSEYFPIARVSLTRSAGPNAGVIVQWFCLNDTKPTALSESGGGNFSSLIYDYALFDPFQRKLEGKPMDVLEGIDQLQIEYRTLVGPDPGQKTKNFRKFLAEVGEVRVEILLNNVIIQVHRLPKAELVEPPPSAVLVNDGVLVYDFQQSEPGAYKNTETLYSQAIAANAQN